MNFLAKFFSFFNKSKSKGISKSDRFKSLLSKASNAEKHGQLENALQFYQDAIAELENSLQHKMTEKYYRSKYSEIRFNIDNLKRQIDDSSGQIINFPNDSMKS